MDHFAHSVSVIVKFNDWQASLAGAMEVTKTDLFDNDTNWISR